MNCNHGPRYEHQGRCLQCEFTAAVREYSQVGPLSRTERSIDWLDRWIPEMTWRHFASLTVIMLLGRLVYEAIKALVTGGRP